MTITFKGLAQLQRKLKRIPVEMQRAAEAGLFEAGSIMLGDAQGRVPVDTGNLRASGFVVTTTLQNLGESARPTAEATAMVTRTETEVTAVVGFGGPSAPYALVQHERTDFHHTVGEAKYLENAVKAHAAEVPVILAAHMERAARGTP